MEYHIAQRKICVLALRDFLVGALGVDYDDDLINVLGSGKR